MKLTMIFLKNHYKKILPIYLCLAHLPHLSADILKEDKNKKIVVDYLVIGAGALGTYMSAHLTKKFPDAKILQVDKMQEFGGLAVSSKLDDSDTYLDLGPIRIYEKIHPRIIYLANQLGLELIEYLPSSENCRAYLRGKSFDINQLFPSSDSVYNISEEEKGKNPFEILDQNIKDQFEFPEELYKLEKRIEIYKNKKLSSMNFWSYAQKKLSSENYNRIQDILGYSNLLELDISFTITALEFLSLSNPLKQYRFKDGFQSFTKALAKKFSNKSFKFDQIKTSPLNGWNTAFESLVMNAEKESDLWKITLGNTKNVKTPEQIDVEVSDTLEIWAKNVFSTIYLSYLNLIYNWPIPLKNIFLNNFTNLPPNRFYIVFEDSWMEDINLAYGKSVTTLPAGQLIHYAPKVMLVYTLSNQTTKLKSLIPNNQPIQKTLVAPNASNQALIDELLDIITQTFNLDFKPKIKGILWATWVEPLKFWAPRNKQTLKDQSLYEIGQQIMYPFKEDKSFVVLENNSSFNPGWTEGSLEIVDFYMHQNYNSNLDGYLELIK
jgi:hypothetical protein